MTKAKHPPDRFDLMDELKPKRMVYNVILELYDHVKFETQYVMVRADSIEAAEEITHAATLQGVTKGVTVVPDVMEYLRRHHPGCVNLGISP